MRKVTGVVELPSQNQQNESEDIFVVKPKKQKLTLDSQLQMYEEEFLTEEEENPLIFWKNHREVCI